jgi:AcrR family transcriptional regulator
VVVGSEVTLLLNPGLVSASRRISRNFARRARIVAASRRRHDRARFRTIRRREEATNLTTDTALGRRERKKIATRRAIQKAALRLAARHGVENVTVEQIADLADVGLRTFFNYFASKEDAVLANTTPGVETLIAELRDRPVGEPVLVALREAVMRVMQRPGAASRDYILALRVVRDSPTLVPRQMAMHSTHEIALAEAISTRMGPGMPPIYPALCAAAALAALRVALSRWLDGENPSRDLLRQEVTDAFALLAAGLDR